MNEQHETNSEADEMEQRVPDRMLERLRLGELSDEEAAEVMARLESSGESHRLDELIAADEEFLERYPAAAAASQIRELRRRRERQPDSSRRSRVRRGPVIVTAITVAAVAVLAISLLTSERTESSLATSDPDVGTAEPPSNDGERGPKVEPERQKAGAAAMEEAGEWNGMLPWLIQRSRTHGPGVMGCLSGRTIEFDATGIERVTTDRADILEVATADDAGRRLKVTCKGSGTATLSVFKTEDDVPRNVMMRVAPAHREERRPVLGLAERLRLTLTPCGELDQMELHVLLDRDARPEMVMVGGGSEADRACVRERALAFERIGKSQTDGDYSLLITEL